MLDDDDRDSVVSSDQDNDDVMEDIDDENNEQDDDGDGDIDGDADGDVDDDNDNDDDDDDNDPDGDADADGDGDGDVDADADADGEAEVDGDATLAVDNDHDMDEHRKNLLQENTSNNVDHTTSIDGSSQFIFRPSLRPEAMTAKVYDIIPTIAAPQSTSINALAVTPDMRYIMTGGADGYIRKYDGVSTINGKLPLTVAQRHPFVDSVFKAGVLMGYWENEEPPPLSVPGIPKEDHVLSPVYSLAVHSDALWVLSGTDSGCINLQTVRHDEGKRIAMLQEHTNAVSCLTLLPDEMSVLSGSWDKRILDWDLNTGQVSRSFDGSGGQISALELRPTGGVPVPKEAALDGPISDSFSSNDGYRNNPLFGTKKANPFAPAPQTNIESHPSPAHESLFGGSDAGSLFGDEVGGGGGFGGGQDFDTFDGGHQLMEDHDDLFGLSAPPINGMSDMLAENQDGPIDAVAANGEHSDQIQDQIQSEMAAELEAAQNAEPDKSNITTFEAGDGEPMALDLSMEAPIIHDKDKEMSLSLAMDNGDPDHPTVPTGSEDATGEDGTVSSSTFMSAAIDGTIRIWDRRSPNPVAKFSSPRGTPPWCMAATWSPDGNFIYVGRRNSTVEEYSVHKAKAGWQPERQLRFPNGSGAISALRAMPNGRHLICASHDILRLYDLKDTNTAKHSVPFLIVPGPPRAGVISHLHLDPSGRFMISTAGTRGWEGTSTEVLIGYEIRCIE